MNDPVFQQLLEISWQRALTESEQTRLRAYLEAHPEAGKAWLLESGLTRALEELPNVPISSNFTARVLQAVELEKATAARAREKNRRFGWPIFKWAPQTAAAAFVLGIGVFTYQQHQTHTRETMAQNVAAVSEFVSASNPELMENFDAIRRLSDPQPKADVELIALLK
ncbi:hypothetical protein [Pedosphaera parvula]|uniref:Uncharacterized protein n=1 Tax=Pedosphaera parvula (strain Ellin514) TaxID=320771 RepID=B9XPW7_PEDPL|nr:hypothetical protein [Pedosphaera parvula]EEF58148.1 hypothetical protein Cflav_PD1492 [Pedosphaera parvula Ellin514]